MIFVPKILQPTSLTMKSFFYLFFLLVAITSCTKKDKPSINDKDYPFEAEVIGPNLDCGIFSIRFTTNLDRVNEIADQSTNWTISIAKNLPDNLQIAGLSIILDFRKIQDTELGPCTAMGPAYPWIYVLKAKLKD
jgi:hypothetical protein